MISETHATTPPWPEDFEKVLRRHLPFLQAGEALTPVASLADLGLDSMGTVSLLIDLEDSLTVSVSDDELLPEMFSNSGKLWEVLTRALAPRTGEA